MFGEKNTHNDCNNNDWIIPAIVSAAVTIIFNYLIGRI